MYITLTMASSKYIFKRTKFMGEVYIGLHFKNDVLLVKIAGKYSIHGIRYKKQLIEMLLINKQ